MLRKKLSWIENPRIREQVIQGIPDVDRKPNFEFIKSALVQANDALFDQITIGTIRIVCYRQIYRWLKHPFDCTFKV